MTMIAAVAVALNDAIMLSSTNVWSIAFASGTTVAVIETAIFLSKITFICQTT